MIKIRIVNREPGKEKREEKANTIKSFSIIFGLFELWIIFVNKNDANKEKCNPQ